MHGRSRRSYAHRLAQKGCFLGIALGVMMVVAVDLANSSARRAFALSVDAVNGNITHQIVGGSTGVPDTVFTALRTELAAKGRAAFESWGGEERLRGCVDSVAQP